MSYYLQICVFSDIGIDFNAFQKSVSDGNPCACTLCICCSTDGGKELFNTFEIDLFSSKILLIKSCEVFDCSASRVRSSRPSIGVVGAACGLNTCFPKLSFTLFKICVNAVFPCFVASEISASMPCPATRNLARCITSGVKYL